MAKVNYTKEMDIELIHLLAENVNDRQFVETVLGCLYEDNHCYAMLQYLRENKNLTQSDILIKLIEIVRKGDLVEAEFKKLNPNIKL